MNLGELLRLAEDASSFLGAEKVRVCFPPAGEHGDCLLLLDGINEVPPFETWIAMEEFNSIGVSSSPEGVVSSPAFQVHQHSESSSSYGATPNLTESDSNDSTFSEIASTTPSHTPACSKRLFALAEGEREIESPSPSATVSVNIACSPSPLPQEKVSPTSKAISSSCLNFQNESSYSGNMKLLTDKLPPTVQNILPRPSFECWQSFHREHTDRITQLSTNNENSAPNNGHVLYYYVTQCFSVQKNLALRAAMLLSAQRGIPLIAVAIVESDVVADVQSPAPPVVTPPLQPLSSIGDKRKHSETMSNSITLSATSQGYSFQVGAGATTWDHRAMALRGLYRKSCTRLAHILRLKKELADLNVPLVTIEYNPSNPRREEVTNPSITPTIPCAKSSSNTNPGSTSTTSDNGNAKSILQSKTSADGRDSGKRDIVTPLQGSTKHNPFDGSSIHPIAQILISLCSFDRAGFCSSHGRTDQNNGHFHTVTPGLEINTSAHEICTESAQCNPKTTFNLNSLATPAEETHATWEGAAVLVTDDLLHPLYRHVHRAVAEALPALTVLSVDSSSSCSAHVLSSAQKKTVDLSNKQSFEQFCAVVRESQKESVGADGTSAMPSLEELSSLLPKEGMHTLDYNKVLKEKLSMTCPYGAVLYEVPDAMITGSKANATPDLNMHEEYGRSLCRTFANDIDVSNNNSTGTSRDDISQNIWSVSWLDALSSSAARTVQTVDARLRELRARNDDFEHNRQGVLLHLCTGTTTCPVYNSLMMELYSQGSVLSCEKLKYWIVYSTYALYSLSQAIQLTYTMLATHSTEDFMCSVSQVSLYVYALREVLIEIGGNLPVHGAVDKVGYFFVNALSKLSSH